jgi:hypothetical protein
MSARAESSIAGCGITGVTLPQALERPTPLEAELVLLSK